MSALAEEYVPSKLAGHPLVQLQRSIVKRNALGSAVVRAQNRRVTAAGSGAQITPVENSDLAHAMFLAEIVGGSQPMYARTNDYDIVAGPQVVMPPHPVFAEELHGSVPQQSESSQTEGLEMKLAPGAHDGLPHRFGVFPAD